MIWRVLIAATLGAAVTGCANQPQRAPAVDAPAAKTSAPQARGGILEQAGDATWGVITTPVRIVGGGAGNKASPQEPAPTLPPAVLISPRDGDDGDADGGQ